MTEKRAVSTELAPKAIGPYSQAVQAGDFLFVSGQIPVDPHTGDIVSGDIGVQTKRVMENIKAILVSQNLSMDAIVKTTIYLTDLADFQTVNGVYGSYFNNPAPARATVQVSSLPKGVKIEIEAVACSYHGQK